MHLVTHPALKMVSREGNGRQLNPKQLRSSSKDLQGLNWEGLGW